MNCLDYELILKLDNIQATATVVGAGLACLSILTGIFEKKYSRLIRRKETFSISQKTEQDKREFAEAVKLAVNKPDIVVITLQDAVCLVILTGCKDTRLREKMSEQEEPTMTENVGRRTGLNGSWSTWLAPRSWVPCFFSIFFEILRLKYFMKRAHCYCYDAENGREAKENAKRKAR